MDPVSIPATLFANGGEMGVLMHAYDWANTSLGAVETWSQSLKTTVRIMLTSRQAMFVWWGDELINLHNDAYRAILGGKHPWALGQPASLVWQEIWDQVGPRAESAIRQNEGTYDEALLLIMERNGYPEETYYTFSYSPIPDDDGSTGGIICANTDDTQRIIGERQLALLRELASKTADARTFDDACHLSVEALHGNPYDLPFAMVYLVDPDHQQVFLAGTSGIESDHPAVFQSVDLNSDCVWSFAEVLATQKPVLIDDLVSRFDQLPTGAWDRPPQQAVAIPIAPSGQTGKAGVLIVGLNPFRLFDDGYQGFIDLVASQIAASIANAQAYEEERKRAEALAEIDRAKTVFFSNVSHEFRTPLTLMLAPTEDALNDPDEPLSATQQVRIQMVQRNGMRLLKLVNTLLDFSRIEAGRVEASYEPTDLAAFTTDLASVFRSTIEQAGMRLVIECPPLPEAVYVDREMWEKILFNLLSNAFKFTFKGEISVSLQWKTNHVELAVRDTGIGIPAAELPHLFERFHRVKGAQGRSFEGSGIGLSLVQELVKLHQGTIEVTSVEGCGTRFTLSIPTGTAHLPSERISASRALASTALGANSYLEEALRWLPQESTEFSGLSAEFRAEASLQRSTSKSQSAGTARIVLADDNVDMRDYVQRLLSQQYEVEAVPDGMAALAAIHEQVPDLVLTDVMMPNLDGFGLLQALRSQPQTREVPIILLSARAGEEARIEGLEAGADDYLTKPFSARELLVRVEAILKLAQLRREATQREQALRLEAQAAQQQVETILSSINDGFFVLDRNWCYTYVNDRLCEMAGKSREELLNHSNWEVFPEAVGTEVYVQFHRAMNEQMRVQFEYLYLPWNRWFEYWVYPSPDGITVFAVETTERKQAEAKLHEREVELIEAQRLGNIGSWYWDVKTDQAIGSEQLFHIYGLDPAIDTIPTFTNQNGSFYPLESWQRIDEAAKRTLETGIGYHLDVQAFCKGRRIWIMARSEVVRDATGEIVGLRGTVQDITERKQAELEREQLLAREQAAREAAQAANRIKDEFLAVLSHELRSPLNPILGWARLLQNSKLDAARTKQALTTIERNAKLQAELIEDLLDVSRILQGKLSLTVSPVNLASTIKAAIETVRLAAESKSIAIDTHLDANIGLVSGDATRLQQVVWNLLSNAVKFTPEGGHVTVQLEQVDHQARITVSDTGKGISPDFLPYVFDYFRQADSATTRKFGGLGLGLAIVRHLVELHGGTIQTNSPGEGLGATFTVNLPLMQVLPKSEPPSQPPQQALTLQGVYILIVDDDTDTRDFIEFLLQHAGAMVTTAASAEEALTALMQSQPDVLLSDIGMPDMDGYMLMQRVRALPPEQGGKTPAIALTAYAGEYDQHQALSVGFQRHLPKPVEPEKLVEVIVSLLNCADY